LKEVRSKPVIRKQTDSLNLSWRDIRYRRFYEVVDRLVDELQEHVWIKTGKHKRRLKGDSLEKLYYSVECLVTTPLFQTQIRPQPALRPSQLHL
jgi:hypothetical protein